MVIREKMIGEVRPFVGKDVVKVITGIRRCGKSVLMSQIRDVIVSEIDVGAPVFYLDLDDEANAAYLKAEVLFKELTSVLEKNCSCTPQDSWIAAYLKNITGRLS